ncbi:septum formation initiator family protein [Desulfoprunum benzoelyticum]|uniref:Cell division protein FtsB n=1 Tax=Desulfoprunum benzoelyticum TaxID=1506996 RepID=A0A840UNC2_9BACT|nr:septum formation initiator family protein [Desulfoprunum benzoelyticum]MBB5347135.1 cell division protein FtsB [Desulfoprunum benzoelyticum]MBM9531232.1 septum formation initiator family protein [Desulfoprunum benzoelyticum]
MKKYLRLYLSPLQERLVVRIVAVLLAVALAWIIFAPRSGVLAYLQQRSKLHDLREKTVFLEKNNEKLEKEIDRLRDDPAYLEEVARREHGLLKKNEYIYDFSQQRKKDSK